MLLKLGLRNFKAFRDQSFDLAPITVFVGRNGTGKSSALQALAFLKQSSLAGEALYAGREGASAIADLGSFEEVVHGGDTALPVRLSMSARMEALGPTPWPTISKYAEYGISHILGELPLSVDHYCPLSGVSSESVEIGNRSISIRTPSPSAPYGNGADSSGIHPSNPHPFNGFESSITYEGALPSLVEMNPRIAKDLEEDVARLGKALPIQLRRFFFIPAGRGFMGQTFPLRNDARGDLSAAGHSGFSSNAATALAMNRGIEEQISDWLETVTGLRIQSDLVRAGEDWGVSIVFQPSRGANGRMPVGANNESFGANQLSQVFLQIALAANDPMVGNEATIGIEEPEVHLHPRAQRDFVEMLAAIAKQGTQFIVSTHSERIVSRLLVLVAKGVLRREDIVVYAFDKDESGAATAEKREIDELGRVSGGIPGFFEESVEDMSEIMAALKERA